MQRLRVRFGRGEEIKYISHLDLMRFWERALRRAGLSLAYTEGFNPHPRISLAAPLSVGVTSEAELMDVFLTRWDSPQMFVNRLKDQLPEGVTLMGVLPVGLNIPSLQSQVRFAEYRIAAVSEGDSAIPDVEQAINALMASQELPWHHYRDTGVRHYDLRALVDDIWIVGSTGHIYTLGMRLRCDSRGTGRPEQIVKALGFSSYPISIHRIGLLLG
jgi:radical SAM-linked protein